MPKEAPKPKNTQVTKKSSKGILIIFILIFLTVTGIAGAIYFNFIDLAILDKKLNFSKIPYIGKHIMSIQKTPSELIDSSEMTETPEVVQPKVEPVIELKPKLPQPKQIQIDTSELQRQATAKLQEEQKRLTKVAKLYDEMKPESAAPILSELEDEIIILIFSKMAQENVAKIMTIFDPKRSAQLSNLMLSGRLQ